MSLIFCSLNICLNIDYFGIYSARCSLTLLDLWFALCINFEKFSAIITLIIFSIPFCLLSLCICYTFVIVHSSLIFCLFFVSLFFLFAFQFGKFLLSYWELFFSFSYFTLFFREGLSLSSRLEHSRLIIAHCSPQHQGSCSPPASATTPG